MLFFRRILSPIIRFSCQRSGAKLPFSGFAEEGERRRRVSQLPSSVYLPLPLATTGRHPSILKTPLGARRVRLSKEPGSSARPPGGADRTRTDDIRLAKAALSQLSYSPKAIEGRARLMVGLGRFELPTSRLSGVRSNQLSYRPRQEPRADSLETE